MLKNRFTADELMEELRIKGFTDVSKIKYAILETSGRLSVLPYAGEQPATARQLKLETQERGIPTTLISDGHLLERNLSQLGLDASWLEGQLHSRGIKSPKDVFLLTIDEGETIQITLKKRPA